MDKIDRILKSDGAQALADLGSKIQGGGHGGSTYTLEELNPELFKRIRYTFDYAAKTVGNLLETIEQLELRLAHEQQSNRTMSEYLAHLQGNEDAQVWFWQHDGEDHPQSMVNDLNVVIRAEHLRQLIAHHFVKIVGTAMDGSNPKVSGLTIATFDARKVPAGTSLYVISGRPLQCFEGGSSATCSCPDCGPCLVQMGD